MNFKRIAVIGMCACLAGNLPAQEVDLQKPNAPLFLRSYLPTNVTPPRLTNTQRLHSLIRGGKLYLTVQDAIALAIENNLDLEVDRFGPLLAGSALKRAEAGGPRRGVPNGQAVANTVTAGQGVAGSEVAAGLSNGGSSSATSGGGAVIQQIGPVTPNLDPVLQNSDAFSHQSSPQANTVVSGTTELISTVHAFSTNVTQGLISGGYVQVSTSDEYLDQNSPGNNLNPSVADIAQLYFRHNLLAGFGVGVNSRDIRVNLKRTVASNYTFQSQLLNLVANVLNLYWDLVSDNENVKEKQHTLDVSRKLYLDTKHEIDLGVLPRVDIYAAQSEQATREREVLVAQTNVRQQENLLKDVLSRNGLQDPLLDAAEIVPLDRIEIPATDELPPLRDMVKTAMAKRPDLLASNLNDEAGQIAAVGTANGLLPQLTVYATTYNSGLAGTPIPEPPGQQAPPAFVGGLGTSLSQVARRDFPNNAIATYFHANFRNQVNQGDYGVEQLQLRQTSLTSERDNNALVVSISNQMVALRQSRARYSAAMDTRKLQEELLDKEQQAFSLNKATITDLIAIQRALSAAQSAEVAALATFSRARVSLDQVLGETLEKNHVSITDALQGRAPAPPSPPH